VSVIPLRSNQISIAEALADYVRRLELDLKVSAPNARALAAKLTGTHSAPRFKGMFALDGRRPLISLNSDDLEALVTARRKAGNSSQTIRHELAVLRAATNYAADRGRDVPQRLVGSGSRKRWFLPPAMTKTRYLGPGLITSS